MHTRIFLFFSLFTFLLPFNLYAEAEIEKKINLSFGTYALTVAYTDFFLNDETLSGTAFSASYAVSNNIAFRGTIFSLNHDDFSEVDASGTDIMGLFGSGFTTQGFKGYLGAGIYNDSWKGPGGSISFNGIQLNGGIGYNWEVIALDLLIGIREQTDYDNLANTDTAVVSSSLSLSARF
ncbi:MAG: hypothetical protein OQK98_11370 [Gammaproteobacteria bacterium]|nr:hypothetical protein [Gammaproteobacteria bacterium]